MPSRGRWRLGEDPSGGNRGKLAVFAESHPFEKFICFVTQDLINVKAVNTTLLNKQ
jgi:hypothetical protein